MASNIETQVRNRLMAMEGVTNAVRAVGRLGPSMTRDDVEDYAYLANFIGEIMSQEFEALHRVVMVDVLPLVADIKSVRI